jgi:predicted glutamine amidotransferase
MCRILLGVNYPINKNFIKKFLSQATNIKTTPGINNYLDADYHMDGYGFAYGNFEEQLKVIKTLNFWNQDPNLNYKLETIIKSKPEIVIGHIRNKGSCEGIKDFNNTHPFIYNKYTMVHNGFIKNFKLNKNKLIDVIEQKYIEEIKGSTDTEHLFYLILTTIDMYLEHYIEDGYPRSWIYLWSFMSAFDYLVNLSIELVGNFIFSDGDSILVVRYKASNFTDSKTAPSLYLGHGYSSFSLVVSSEPMTPYYELFPDNSYLILY